VDVVTPDPQKIGGLLEFRVVAMFADTWGLPIAPHNIASPIGTLANAHACASVSNFLALEWHSSGVPFFDELVGRGDDPLIQDGHIEVPDLPGIGVDLDLDVCRRHARPNEPFFA
jgi:gluconate/galactonate dehydratase